MGNFNSKMKKSSTLILENKYILYSIVNNHIYYNTKIYFFSFKNTTTFMGYIWYNSNTIYLRKIKPKDFLWDDVQYLIKKDNIKLAFTYQGYQKLKDYFNSHYKKPII